MPGQIVTPMPSQIATPTPSSIATETPGPTITETSEPEVSDSPELLPSEESKKQVEQIIQVTSVTKVYGSKPFYLNATTNGDGKLSYISSEKKVAKISSKGKVTLKGYGKTVITVYAAETEGFLASQKKVTITVIPKNVTVKKLLSNKKKTISYNWKPDDTVEGYQIYISTKSDFSMETFQRLYGKKKGSVSLFGLKSGTKYYIKIRSYVVINKKKYYGRWSKVKSVKVK